MDDNTYFLTYLLTPCGRVLLQKLTGSQLVKIFPAFHGTRKFITAFTSVRHLSQSWARSIQSILSHPTSKRSILILSSHLRLGLTSGFFPLSFRHLNPIYACQIDPVYTITSHLQKIHLNTILPSTPGSSKWPLFPQFSPPKHDIRLPDRSSLYYYIHFQKIHLNTILPSTPGPSKWPLSPQFSPPKPDIRLPDRSSLYYYIPLPKDPS